MIPERYKDADYSQLPDDLRAKFKKAYAERKGLYIYGAVGTGKTHYAYAIVK